MPIWKVSLHIVNIHCREFGKLIRYIFVTWSLQMMYISCHTWMITLHFTTPLRNGHNNSLVHKRCGNNFKLVFTIDILDTSCEIARMWMRQSLITDTLTLVQVMTWCCQATNNYLICRHEASLCHNELNMSTVLTNVRPRRKLRSPAYSRFRKTLSGTFDDLSDLVLVLQGLNHDVTDRNWELETLHKVTFFENPSHIFTPFVRRTLVYTCLVT